MARPLRITYPGAFYHVTSRGNERKDIFRAIVIGSGSLSIWNRPRKDIML